MSRPPRLPGFDYLGLHQYSVTFCSLDRADVFRDDAIAALVLLHFRRTVHSLPFALLAYCLMPDHVHILVEGTRDDADFKKFMKRLKQSSGQAYTHRAGCRLWQDGYYERVLRGDEDARTVARYIIENPVRAGLVREPQEYPWVGSDVWSIEELIESVR